MDMKWKWQPHKIKTENESVNKELKNIFMGYFKNSTTKELIYDLCIPSAISLILFILIGIFSDEIKNVIVVINDIITNSLSVMAILAGFNTTCVAVIASTNKATLKKLIKEGGSNNEENSILHKTIIFFSYAICSEIFLLIVGFIYVIINNNLKDIYYCANFINTLSSLIIALFIGFVLSTLILHSLFVSLRNVALLFRYILFIANNDDE